MYIKFTENDRMLDLDLLVEVNGELVQANAENSTGSLSDLYAITLFNMITKDKNLSKQIKRDTFDYDKLKQKRKGVELQIKKHDNLMKYLQGEKKEIPTICQQKLVLTIDHLGTP